MVKVRLSTLLLILLPLQLQALSSDSEQPIAVEADKLEVRDGEKISIYEGNVSLVQGSLQIQSDRLVIHFGEAGVLMLMEMTGNPARFRQLDDEQQELVGEAAQIDYLESESTLELRGNAKFRHAGDSIESNLIRINTENNAIRAGSSQPDERVKMLIRPKQE